MTTFKELMENPIESVDNDFCVLMGCYYNHLEEDIDQYRMDYDKIKAQDRVEIRYYKDWCYDGRRVWKLYSVWLDGELVMMCKNAGREGDDHSGRAIFNKELYVQLVQYIKTFEYPTVQDDIGDCVNLEDNADHFETFYSETLKGYFERW